MTALETTVVVVLAAWMLVLTVTLLVAIRQIAVIMLLLDRDGEGPAPVDDGIDVGSELPTSVARLIDPLPDRPSFVLVLAAVCGPCRELAPQLDAVSTSTPLTVLVVGGDPRLAGELAQLVPSPIRTVTGGAARDASTALGITTTPFVFEFREQRLAAKAAVRGLEHLQRYVDEAEAVTTSDLGTRLEVAP
jgi:thiol-disulfide isomerase/thioredoxin